MKTKWIATKRFERSAPQTYPQRGVAGEMFDRKADAESFARRENRRHGSGYVVLPTDNDYAVRHNYINAIR